jgi:hypothetical protein
MSSKLSQNKWLISLIPIVLVLTFAVAITIAAKNDAVTSDETAHIPAGWTYAKYGIFALNNEHPALMKLLSGAFLLPFDLNFPQRYDPSKPQDWEQWTFGDSFLMNSGNDMDLIIFWARLPAILMAIGLVIVVYFWTKKLTGSRKAGIAALILAIFSPIILAHGRLANTDTPLTFFYVLSFFSLWAFLDKPNLLRASALGLSVGGGVAVKFSAPVIVPIVFILIIIKLFLKPKDYPVLRMLGMFLAAIIIGATVVWGSYIIAQRNEIRLAEPVILGQTFNHRVVKTPKEKIFYLPLDRYLEGFEVVRSHSQIGHPSYLLGEYRIKGWWYYFPYTFLVKTPLVTLFLFGLALVTLWWGARKRTFGWIITLLPLFVFLGMSLFNHINIGVRHIMPIYPLVFVSAIAGSWWLTKYRIWQVILVLLLLFYIFDSASHYPSYMAYFNQLIGSNHNHYRYLADSNVYWSQDDRRMADYLKSQAIAEVYMPKPSSRMKYYGIKIKELEKYPELEPGEYIVISANDMALPPKGAGTLDWLIKNYQPIHHIGYSIYLYRI